MAVWDDVIEEQFVIMVQERPALYDSTDRNYNNRTVKQQLWADIELKLHTTEKEMRRRWESLRTQYVRYQKMLPTGRTPRQHWILSKLQFLEPHTRTKEYFPTYSDKESYSGDFDCESEPHSDAPWTSSLLEACAQSPAPETAPLDSPGLPQSESTHPHQHQHHPPETHSEPRTPRAKRFKREEPIVFDTTSNLIAVINRTLEQLSREKEEERERDRERRGEGKAEREDGISIYLKYFEHRLRALPPQHLPRAQRDIENILCTYSVEENKTDL